MEKEKVLEIETQEVFDKIAIRIKYLNDDFFADGLLKEDVEKYNCNMEESPYNIKEYVLFLGDNIIISDKSIYCYTQEEIKKIIEFVDFINKKYGILKRFKPENCEEYYFILSDGYVISKLNYMTTEDKSRYDLGNCFETEEEAEKVKVELDKFWAKVRAGEIGND